MGLDRTIFWVGKTENQPKDIHFWSTQSHESRLAALFQLRSRFFSLMYSDEDIRKGFQRVYRVVK